MDNLKKQMMEINQLSSELDRIYHDIAQNYGLSDSVFWILSVLHDNNTHVSQTDLCNGWHYSKQTINSAVASMIKKGWIKLEVIPATQNKKNIVLTKTGQDLCDKVIGDSNRIEEATYSKFTEEERAAFLDMFRKMNQYMREEFSKRQN